MQKKIIAAAIIGMVSTAASAATVYDKDGLKVSLGGKFDFALEKKQSVGAQVGSTAKSFSMQDGKFSTSRLTLGAEQAINSDLSAYYSVDLRFSSFFNGKNSDSTTAAGTTVAGDATTKAQPGGLNTNDAKKGGLLSKKFGRIEAGTINNAVQQFAYGEKSYQNTNDNEMVKYGIISQGLEALSNRTIYVHTNADLPVVLKASYSISDEAAVDADTSNANKNGLWGLGFEFRTPNKKFSGGLGTAIKQRNSNYDGTAATTGTIKSCPTATTCTFNADKAATASTQSFMRHTEAYLAVRPVEGLKVAALYNRDYAETGAATPKWDAAKQELTLSTQSAKSYGLNVSYAFSKFEISAARQRVVDTSDYSAAAVAGQKNNGWGYMLGAEYFATKGVTFFVGKRFDNWEKEQSLKNKGKIVGNKAGFVDSQKKNDLQSVYAGMNFSF